MYRLHEHVRLGAKYNMWANERLYGVCGASTQPTIGGTSPYRSPRFTARSTTCSSWIDCGWHGCVDTSRTCRRWTMNSTTTSRVCVKQGMPKMSCSSIACTVCRTRISLGARLRVRSGFLLQCGEVFENVGHDMGYRYPKRNQLKYTKQHYRIRNWPEYEAGFLKRCVCPPSNDTPEITRTMRLPHAQQQSHAGSLRKSTTAPADGASRTSGA